MAREINAMVPEIVRTSRPTTAVHRKRAQETRLSSPARTSNRLHQQYQGASRSILSGQEIRSPTSSDVSCIWIDKLGVYG